MYIVDHCIWYNHTCGMTDEPSPELESLKFYLSNILSTTRIFDGYCPGHHECKYGKIYQSGYKLIKDRFEARRHYKQIQHQLKELRGGN